MGAQPTAPSLRNHEPSSAAPNRYFPGGRSSARLQSLTSSSRDGPFMRKAKSSSSGARWQPSAMISVLISPCPSTNSAMLPCIGTWNRWRIDATELIAHQK